MPKVSFDRRIPIHWDTPAEEFVWYYEHLRVDGVQLHKRELAEVCGVTHRNVYKWLNAAKDRQVKRKMRAYVSDPPPRVLRLLRLELGLAKPLWEQL